MISSPVRPRLVVVVRKPRTEGKSRARRKHVSKPPPAVLPLPVLAMPMVVDTTIEPYFPDSLMWLKTAPPNVRNHFLDQVEVRTSRKASLLAIVRYFELVRKTDASTENADASDA